jgi:uncharacterized protein YkwD
MARARTGFVALLATIAWAAAASASPQASMAPESSGTTCDLEHREFQLAALLLGGKQQRVSMACRPELQAFARRRALDMARRGYLAHRTPEGKGPNQLLRDTGYPLPPSYLGGLSNNIESIVGGVESPHAVWRALVDSRSHRPHLLGEGPVFQEQDEFGIAYVRDIYSPHVDYWVIVITRRARPDDQQLLCTPQPAECFRTAANDPD